MITWKGITIEAMKIVYTRLEILDLLLTIAHAAIEANISINSSEPNVMITDDLKAFGWSLNSEYFSSILHELRDDPSYRAIVDARIEMPPKADTRDTEAIKRICTAYLKLLFPHVRRPQDISSRDFNRYCLQPAMDMRAIIRIQMGIADEKEAGKTVPSFSVIDA